MSPTVSILLFTYNRVRYLAESLPALLNQTYRDFELIVVDNASTDETPALVMGYSDPRLIYLRRSMDAGFLFSWGDAASRALGKYALMTHDDDVAHPRLVEEEVRVLEENPQVGMVSANVRTIGPTGSLISPSWYPVTGDRHFDIGDYLKALALEHFCPTCPTYMLRMTSDGRRITKGAPRYDIDPVGDIFLCSLINVKHPIYWLSEPLLDYRLHPEQESWQREVSIYDLNLAKALIYLAKRHPKARWALPYLQANLQRYLATDQLTRTGEADLGPMQSLPNMKNLMPWKPDGRARALKGSRVAIFGSSLNAYLLLKECEASGVQVLSCLDSRECRHGAKVGEVPVVPFGWLKDHAVDLILSSSERREVGEVGSIIGQALGHSAPAQVCSWKDLKWTSSMTCSP